MNWAFTLLGVSPDVDAVGVKRAYARLLRDTRPDEDAEGFQQLHAAYKLVLAHVNGRAARATASSSDIAPTAGPVVAADPALDLHAPVTTERMARATSSEIDSGQQAPVSCAETNPPVNPGELVRRVIRHAVATNEEHALSGWLSSQPEFWSLRIKQQTGQLLLQQLFGEPQPMAAASLDELLQFFDLQQVLSGVDPIELDRLRRRQLALWYLLAQNHHELDWRVKPPANRIPVPEQLSACLALLRSPLRWRSVPGPALRNRQTAAVARLVHELCGGQISELPAQIDRRQALFWSRAAETGVMSGPRFAVGSVRSVFVALILLTSIIAITVTGTWLGGSDLDLTGMLAVAGSLSGAALVIWLVYAGWQWLVTWQCLPETSAAGRSWLRLALIPLLCAFGLGLDYLADAPAFAAFAIMPALILALRRTSQRLRPGHNRIGAALVSLLPVAGYLCVVVATAVSKIQPDWMDRFPLLATLVLLTMAVWLADAWRNRHYLTRGPRSLV